LPADVSILAQKGNESKIGSNPNGEMVALHAPKGDQPKGLFPDRRGFGETGLCQLHFCSSIWAVIDLVVHRFLLQKEAPSSVKAPVFILGPVKLLIEGFPYPPWFLFWKKSFTLGGSMLKPFLGNCAQITGKNPSSRFEGCPGTCCSFKIYITYIMYIV